MLLPPRRVTAHPQGDAPQSLRNTAVQYEISKAYHPQSCILSSESGALVQYVGDNADINVYTLDAIEESEHRKNPVIVGPDIDLFVILIGRTQSHEEEVFSKKVGKENVKTQKYSSKSFDKYPHYKKAHFISARI
ncbi:hypothetical protein TNCV_1984161 [Trichonephila clavipes]|nr:hypothetical protein TNCV_1984161 [Trichonephila clavipes]